VREPIGVMNAAPAAGPDGAVRRAQVGDLPALDELCLRFYKTSRRNELAAWIERGFAVLVHEVQGRIHGYLAPVR